MPTLSSAAESPNEILTSESLHPCLPYRISPLISILRALQYPTTLNMATQGPQVASTPPWTGKVPQPPFLFIYFFLFYCLWSSTAPSLLKIQTWRSVWDFAGMPCSRNSSSSSSTSVGLRQQAGQAAFQAVFIEASQIGPLQLGC